MQECSIFSTHDGRDTKSKHVKQLWIVVKILTLEEPVDFFVTVRTVPKAQLLMIFKKPFVFSK
jgi:hypothetical protein